MMLRRVSSMLNLNAGFGKVAVLLSVGLLFVAGCGGGGGSQRFVGGDFRFDGLGQNSGAYTVELQPQDRDTQTVQVDLTSSLNLGTIMI